MYLKGKRGGERGEGRGEGREEEGRERREQKEGEGERARLLISPKRGLCSMYPREERTGREKKKRKQK